MAEFIDTFNESSEETENKGEKTIEEIMFPNFESIEDENANLGIEANHLGVLPKG